VQLHQFVNSFFAIAQLITQQYDIIG